MSSTVNIISEIIKNTISVPIQALTSRPENYQKLYGDKKDGKKLENNNEGESYSNIKESLDVVFVLVDDFNGEKALEGEKYALVRPVDVGLSSEDHYSVKTGLKDEELIVTGRFRILSKELQHGMKVNYEDESRSD